MQIPVVLDRSSTVPLYQQLAEQLVAAIEDGLLKPGDPFENEVDMARRLDVSRPTVRQAIADLVRHGLLVRRRGVGTTVASAVIHRRDELTSLHDDMLRRGQQPQTRVLALRKETNPVAARALGLPIETTMLFVERLRMADQVPTALMHNWLPPRYDDLTAEELDASSLYAVLRDRGAHPVVAHQTIGARRPTAAERRLLGLAAGDPLLTMSRRAFDAEGAPVEFGDHCYRYDQYAFDVTVHEPDRPGGRA
ncbi:GntR family transcriptional regulator [Aestuariimicrobium ganziense]|uniref:GntR family transcriptional regulator n=1 Tax=Aestuariimicrobium ganziense TaxID=2773677 RepID=UPI001941276E|nr:GntR family transcriptional regulator [Aestuariimicrobium ganziense]